MIDRDWIDRSAYPFESHVLELDAGRMHYVDEGDGPPIVMVHGTPTWSFLYRDLVKALSPHYRCIVPDHIGFGLSDKPAAWSYRPADHARNLHTLIDYLELKDVTLVVHDFGGPIGLSYAIEQPENVHALVVCNTWMWATEGDPNAERAARVVQSPIGTFLYKRLNFSPRMLMRMMWGEKSKLTRSIHQHYIKPFPTPADRQGPLMFARALLGESPWYAQLWQQRKRIADKPALLLWGLRDPAFTEQYLQRWKGLFPHAQIETFPMAGHFVQEEVGAALGPIITQFLENTAQHARLERSVEAMQLS